MSSYFAKYEPEAEGALSPEHAALVSVAISLKRIADHLGNTEPGDGDAVVHAPDASSCPGRPS